MEEICQETHEGLSFPVETKVMYCEWADKGQGHTGGFKKSWKEGYGDMSKSGLGKELSIARWRQGKIFPKQVKGQVVQKARTTGN